MKLKFGSIVAVLVILTAMIVAGCTTSSSGPSNTPTGLPSGANAAGNLTMKSLINNSNVKWYDYNETTVIAGMQSMSQDMRADFGVDFNGTKATRYNSTAEMVILNNTTDVSTDMYIDPSTGAMLGGHIRMSINGNVTDTNLTSLALPTQGSGDAANPLLVSGNASLSMNGTESVTVPAGTFTASKYDWVSGTSTGTVWIASSVPIPVKIIYGSQGYAAEMDLKGWG